MKTLNSNIQNITLINFIYYSIASSNWETQAILRPFGLTLQCVDSYCYFAFAVARKSTNEIVFSLHKRNLITSGLKFVRGIFVMMPCVVLGAIAARAWVLRRGSWRVEPKIQPRTQILTQGLMGHLPRIFWEPRFMKPK